MSNFSRTAQGEVLMTTPVLHTEGGRLFDGVFAKGADKGGAAVLVLHEMFGVSEAMCMAAEEFAAAGVPALVPNMFWRAEVTRALDYEGEDRELAWARLAAFDKDRGVSDLGIAADWMLHTLGASRPLVLVGFCGGGLWSYLGAAHGRYAGSVSYYALGIAKHLDLMTRIACPIQLHYGLVDRHIPREEIDAVSKAAAANPNVSIFTYEAAGHSFATPKRPSFDAEASKLAMTRIAGLLAGLGQGRS